MTISERNKNGFYGAIIGFSVAFNISWFSVNVIGGEYGLPTLLLLLVITSVGFAIGHMKNYPNRY